VKIVKDSLRNGCLGSARVTGIEFVRIEFVHPGTVFLGAAVAQHGFARGGSVALEVLC